MRFSNFQKFPNCPINSDSSRKTKHFFCVTTSLFSLRKVYIGRFLAVKVTFLAAESGDFVLCLGILLIQECQKNGNGFDNFSLILTTSPPYTLT